MKRVFVAISENTVIMFENCLFSAEPEFTHAHA